MYRVALEKKASDDAVQKILGNLCWSYGNGGYFVHIRDSHSSVCVNHQLGAVICDLAFVGLWRVDQVANGGLGSGGGRTAVIAVSGVVVLGGCAV